MLTIQTDVDIDYENERLPRKKRSKFQQNATVQPASPPAGLLPPGAIHGHPGSSSSSRGTTSAGGALRGGFHLGTLCRLGRKCDPEFKSFFSEFRHAVFRALPHCNVQH